MSDIENTDIILFLLLYLIYFGAILYYFKYNHNRNLSIFWIDFFMTISIEIVFTIIYFITLLKNQANKLIYVKNVMRAKLMKIIANVKRSREDLIMISREFKTLDKKKEIYMMP